MNVKLEIHDPNGVHVGPVVFDGPQVIGGFIRPENVERLVRSKGRVVIEVKDPAGVEFRAEATEEDAT